MTDEIVVPSEGARKKPFILFRIAQWAVAALVGILTIVPLADISKLAIPGAPTALLWSALAALVFAAAILSPPLFFRLPLKAKVGAYIGGFAAFMLLGVYFQQMQAAYERTPAGAAEAKARAESEAALAKADAIARGLTDKGAMGMVRWVRLPNGINGKPMHEVDGKPFTCRLHGWNPEHAYAANRLLEALLPVVHADGPQRPAPKASARDRSNSEIGSKVYIPRADENPVLAVFKAQGLYKREISAGKHEVTCPWANEHTDLLDTGAAYFEPDAAFPTGGFCCQHSHKDKYHIGQVLDHFGLTTADARNKTLIRAVAGEMKAIVMAAEEVLAQRGDLYQSGGLIVTTGRDPVTGDETLIPLSEPALTLALSEACDWERFDKRSGAWERCDPLPRHVSLIYKAQSYDRLPPLLGLARQPYYRELDGQLVRTPGYDPVSQRLGIFDAAKFPPVEATREAAEKALAQLEELLCEFHFAAPADKAAALSAIFTAVTRPALAALQQERASHSADPGLPW